jgi:hypothetical protein
MRLQHLNTLFGFFSYVLEFERIFILEKCRTLASRRITFSKKSEVEIDETCFMQIFWDLDYVLGNAIPNILTTKQRQQQQQQQQ